MLRRTHYLSRIMSYGKTKNCWVVLDFIWGIVSVFLGFNSYVSVSGEAVKCKSVPAVDHLLHCFWLCGSRRYTYRSRSWRH